VGAVRDLDPNHSEDPVNKLMRLSLSISLAATAAVGCATPDRAAETAAPANEAPSAAEVASAVPSAIAPAPTEEAPPVTDTPTANDAGPHFLPLSTSAAVLPTPVRPSDGAVEVRASALTAPADTYAHIVWTRRGTASVAATIAGCRDGSLYALNTDKNLYRNTSGGADTGWVYIATLSVAQDITCSDRLFAFNTDRALYRNDGTPTSIVWTRVGQPTSAKQVSAGWALGSLPAAPKPALYALNDDNTLWRSPTGADGTWTKLGQPSAARRISAGKTAIYALNNSTQALYRGNGVDTGWSYIDTPSLASVVSDDGSVASGGLWALNTDGGVYHGVIVAGSVAPPLVGMAWENRGRPTSAIKIAGCADGSLYALNADKSLWLNKNGGADASWVRAGAASLAADITCSNVLYAFNTDRALYRNDGTATSLVFTRVGQPSGAKQVSARLNGDGSTTFYAINDDNTLWTSKTAADGTWTNVSTAANTYRIAAARTGIWQLTSSLALNRGDGSATGWTKEDQASLAAEITDDGGSMSGAIWALNTDKTLWHGTTLAGPNGIEYHGGPIMAGAANVYYIWYGTWSATDKTILTDLANNLSGAYWNINSTYRDTLGNVASNTVAFGGSIDDPYSQGKVLADAMGNDRGDIVKIVQNAITTGKAPADSNGIYVVYTASDVTVEKAFCTTMCGYHYHNAGVKSASGAAFDAKYALIPFSGSCGVCQVHSTPNGSVAADSMASVTVHELTETITDPDVNAWSNPGVGGEDGDMCAWNFGSNIFSAPNGQRANLTLGTRSYLVQQNWINSGAGRCGMAF